MLSSKPSIFSFTFRREFWLRSRGSLRAMTILRTTGSLSNDHFLNGTDRCRPVAFLAAQSV